MKVVEKAAVRTMDAHKAMRVAAKTVAAKAKEVAKKMVDSVVNEDVAQKKVVAAKAGFGAFPNAPAKKAAPKAAVKVGAKKKPRMINKVVHKAAVQTTRKVKRVVAQKAALEWSDLEHDDADDSGSAIAASEQESSEE